MMSTLLIVVGVVLFLAGLGRIGASQSGGFNNILKNYGVNFGGSIRQENRQDNVRSTTAFDWSGVIIAALGVNSAVFGYLTK